VLSTICTELYNLHDPEGERTSNYGGIHEFTTISFWYLVGQNPVFDCFNRVFVLLEYIDPEWQSTANIWAPLVFIVRGNLTGNSICLLFAVKYNILMVKLLIIYYAALTKLIIELQILPLIKNGLVSTYGSV